MSFDSFFSSSFPSGGAPPPSPTEPPAQQPEARASKDEGLIKTIQNFIAMLVAFGAILTATGFVVVNTFLNQYTDLHGYNVLSTTYLTGGVGLLLAFFALATLLFVIFMISFVVRILIFILIARLTHIDQPPTENSPNPSRASRTIRAISNGLIFILFFVVAAEAIGVNRLLQVAGLIIPFLGALILLYLLNLFMVVFSVGRFWLRFVEQPFSIYGVIVLVILVGLFSLSGYIYSQTIYGTIDRSIGGGKPATAVLIYAGDDEAVTRISQIVSPNQQNAPLCILSELNDGYLIYNPATLQTIALQDAAILALQDTAQPVDCSPPDRNATPLTPIPPTPTPSVTHTP
ncbi:hypothetical protein G4Y79_02120 [Phototrophicus methaneseepsis]|uniref:Uncharacterized protein n=1 Tax=Phototrophicus methaneseepsis TaxID=2710758 RepID=A0A7S8EAC5_9CHLR|nr:hypothetical protein [Phototrophicus methaneseepsis]QPC83194.1 hypothetical protein G4Y79_02120 [Phototrophicus methaneseepsis]